MVEILSLIGIFDLKVFDIPENNSAILSSRGAEVSTALMTISVGNLFLINFIAVILLSALINS